MTSNITITGSNNDSNLVIGSTSARILENSEDISNTILNNLQTKVNLNVTSIATNKTAIATNVLDISTNKAGIAKNVLDISTNKAGIAKNVLDISINKAAIATNASAIASNLVSINTNTAQDLMQTNAINALYQVIGYSNNYFEKNVDLLAEDISKLDIILAGKDISASVDFIFPYLTVSGNTITEDVSLIKVITATYDENYHLDLSSTTVKQDTYLGIPFFSQSNHADYLKFVNLNSYETVFETYNFTVSGDTFTSSFGLSGDVSNLSLTDISFYNALSSIKTKRYVNSRDPLGSELLFAYLKTPSTGLNLQVKQTECSTTLSVDEIKKYYTANTFNKIPNVTQTTDNENITNSVYYIDRTKDVSDNYDFIVDTRSFNNHKLYNGETIGFAHFLFGMVALNNVNVKPVSANKGMVLSGFSSDDSALSLTTNPLNKFKINTIKRLWSDVDYILHINANVKLENETPLEAFNRLLAASCAYPIEYLNSEITDNSGDYIGLDKGDGYKQFIMNLFKSQVSNQKNKYSTETKFCVKNTVNGYLPDISSALDLSENSFELEPIEPSNVSTYSLTDAGFEYFISNASNLTIQQLNSALLNTLYVTKTVTTNTKSNTSLTYRTHTGSDLGTPGFLLENNISLSLNKNNKLDLLSDKLKFLGSAYKGVGCVTDNTYQNNKTGYMIFKDTPQSDVVNLVNDASISFMEGLTINTYGDNKIVSKAEVIQSTQMDCNFHVVNDFTRLALLVFDNKYTTYKAVSDPNIFTPSNEMFIDTSGAKEWFTNVYNSTVIDISGTGVNTLYTSNFNTETQGYSIDFSNNIMTIKRPGKTHSVYKSELESLFNISQYGILDVDNNITLPGYRGTENAEFKKQDALLRTSAATALSLVNGDTSANNLTKINKNLNDISNNYVTDKYQLVIQGALSLLDASINQIDPSSTYDISGTVNEKLTWLSTEVRGSEIVHAAYDGYLLDSLLNVLDLSQVPVPDSSNCIIFDTHFRITGVFPQMATKSMTSQYILKNKCNITNARLIPYIGNGDSVTELINGNAFLPNNYINDPSKNPLMVFSRFNQTNEPSEAKTIENLLNYYYADANNNSYNKAYFYGGQFVDIVYPFLPSASDNKILSGAEILKALFNTPINLFGNATVMSLAIIDIYFDGLFSVLLLYMILTVKIYKPQNVSSADAKTQLSGLLANGMKSLYNDILDSSVNSTIFGVVNGVTDASQIALANTTILNSIDSNTELHRVLSAFITKHGSYKKLFAPGILKFINQVAYFTKVTGYDTDINLMNAYNVLIDPSNIELTNEIAEVNRLMTTNTVSNGVTYSIYNKSQFPEYIPATIYGQLKMKDKADFFQYSSILAVDPSL